MNTAELDAIAGEELADSQDLQAQANAAQQAQQEENADGWRQAVRAAGDIVTSALPEASPVWTRERMDNLGDALARCDEHYGWGGAGALLSNPLLALAVAAFPLALGTAQVYKTVKAKAEAEEAIAKARNGLPVPTPPATQQADIQLAQPVEA